MTVPVRLALVGVGRWGRAILRTTAALPGVRVVAVTSSDPTTAAWMPPGCEVMPRWQDILERPDLDGLLVATPAASHEAIVMAALARNLPVFVEKPLTPDLASTLRVASAASEGAGLLVDHVHLFHAGYEALRGVLQDAGPIVGVLTEGGASGPVRPDLNGLWDYGPHDAAFVVDLLGVAAVRRTSELRLPAALGGGSTWTVEGDASGVPFRLKTGNGFVEKRRRLAVFTGDAALVLDDLTQPQLRRFAPVAALTWPAAAGAPVAIPDDRLPLERAIDAFARGITDPTSRDGRWGTATAVEVARLLTDIGNTNP